MKNIVLTVFFMASFIGVAQVNLNEYKYVVVPKKFDDFKKENQYQTSTLIKYLFSKKGFTVVYEDNLPVDLSGNRCLGLYVDLIDDSSMFTTKTTLKLNDCNNQEVFLAEQGKSKKKDYKESYDQAIKGSFASFSAVNYSYEPNDDEKTKEPVIISFDNDVKKVDKKPDLKKQQERLSEQIATEEVQSYKDKTPIESNYKKSEPSYDMKSVEQTATKEEQSFKDVEPIQSDYEKEVTSSTSKMSIGILYAQELPNGYQLVDSTPKIQLKIYKSSMPNVYIAKADAHDGVVYTSDGKWFFEYHEGDQIVKEELNIKF